MNALSQAAKSLLLQDMGGGKVTTVVYPSQDPIEKTLKSFQVDITGDPSLAQLLAQLRGAKVLLMPSVQPARLPGLQWGRSNVPGWLLHRWVRHIRGRVNRVMRVSACGVARQRPVIRVGMSSYLNALQDGNTLDMCRLGKHIEWLYRV